VGDIRVCRVASLGFPACVQLPPLRLETSVAALLGSTKEQAYAVRKNLDSNRYTRSGPTEIRRSAMSPLQPPETIGSVTFADCGENKSDLKLFRVNAGVPIKEALEHASHVLYYATMLSLEAAMDPRAERFAFASHYLGEMGKAIIDDLLLAIQPGEPLPR